MHPSEESLNELVDGTLAPAARAETERHVEGCPQCRAIVRELRDVRQAVDSLELREPPAGVWPRIERALRSARHVGAATDGGAPGHRAGVRDSSNALARFKRSRAVWIGLAAAAVVVLAAALTLRMAVPRSGPAGSVPEDSSRTAGSIETAQAVEAELRQASEHYERAIKGLEQIANAEQGALDPATAETLRKNLAVIDQAINESRTALHTQPNSEPAQQSLIDSFKTKIALLQDTVALINEMRKGNEAGAAKIVSGLKQKG
jgi:anti-sigma factor RsiW